MLEEFFTCLEDMSQLIERASWDELDKKFYHQAYHTHPNLAEQISKIDLAPYSDALKTAFLQAIAQAKQKKLSAIYFEYDSYENWSSDFFLCKYYVPKNLLNGKEYIDDWACEFDEETITGPNIFEFEEIKHNSDEIQLYLIARMTAFFARVYDQIKVDNLAICIAFHDQDPIFRIQEFYPTEDKLFNAEKIVHLELEPKPEPEPLTDLEYYVIKYYSPLLQKLPLITDIKMKIQQALKLFKEQIFINNCPFCGHLRRTPKAKSCPACFERE